MSRIPKTHKGTLLLAVRAIGGLRRLPTLGVVHNDAAAVSEALHNFVGPPGEGSDSGKSGRLNSERDALNVARQNRRMAMAAGRKFCGDAVDLLKAHLGRRWNARWLAAGFTRGSLALPHNPLALLLELRGYFRENPGREIPQNGITAAEAEARAAALERSTHLRDRGLAGRARARDERDAAYQRLRKRLIGLRNELTEFLADDDHRWLEFGFDCPADRSRRSARTKPKISRPIIVQWNPAAAPVNTGHHADETPRTGTYTTMTRDAQPGASPPILL